MLRAVQLAVHGADRAVRRADGLAAGGALLQLVHAYRLVHAALTVPQAPRAQAPDALGRGRVTVLRVAIADDPAAAVTRREAARARRMAVRRAHALVCGAMLQPAGRAHPHMLVAHRLTVHATLDDAVIAAEVLRAHRAAVRAGVTGGVVVPADHELGERLAALRAGD